jgi:hypothetical protein
MFQTPSTTHLCISDVLNCPPPPRLERSSVSSHFHINNVASMFAPLPFDCYGRKSSLFTSRRVLKPRSVFGTQESAFARLNVALIQEDEEVNERPREDAITESYSQLPVDGSSSNPAAEASSTESFVSFDPSPSNDNTVDKAEVPSRRGSLKQIQDGQRVSYCNSAA